ncbi:MAG: hypothetical protein J2P17_28970, partial [Mycobacterium sp.]|nr:hypothetical protein [Mycobacterium sp.]
DRYGTGQDWPTLASVPDRDAGVSHRADTAGVGLLTPSSRCCRPGLLGPSQAADYSPHHLSRTFAQLSGAR